MTETCRWRGGTEMLLRHGAGSPLTLLVLPALFEEGNRMRRFTVSVMRTLAARGIGTILPDMPGTGESITDLADVALQDWHDAISELIGNCSGSIAFRGGALLDADARHRWRLAPESGERLLRDMTRATAFSEGVPGSTIDILARAAPTRLAGNLFNPELYTALHEAAPIGDAHITSVEGQKLWRAAEPGDDAEFVERVAQDIIAWTTACGA
jgi:hypothetical protein